MISTYRFIMFSIVKSPFCLLPSEPLSPSNFTPHPSPLTLPTSHFTLALQSLSTL